MISIVIIEKSGNVKQVMVKEVSRETLYSKCGFRKAEGFEKRTVWNVELNEKYNVELWSRNDGKANTENKYDFPPPVDNELYFGNCCVVRIDEESDAIIDLTMSEWNKIYDNLFGGFEDLVDEEPSEDELENVPSDMKTQSGYLKDGFVVGTDSDSDASYVEDGVEGNDETNETESESDSELETETYYYSDDE
jgi:hypothetical protein